jgi:hypothetical protein
MKEKRQLLENNAWRAVHLCIAVPAAVALIYFIAMTRKDLSCSQQNVCPVGVFSNAVYHTLTLALGVECARLAFLLLSMVLFIAQALRVGRATIAGMLARAYVLRTNMLLSALVCGALFSNQIILKSAGKKDRDTTILFALTIVDICVDVFFI